MNGFAKALNVWLPLIGVIIIGIGGWMLVSRQAAAALSREEAYKTFVTMADADKASAQIDARLIRMEDKLDRLLERK